MSECNQNESNECECVDQVLNTPCPVDISVEKNTKAFFEAMHAAKVDIIKEKIKAECGEHLGKEADAIVKAMCTHWHSMIAQAKAQCELRETIKGIYCEASDGACETK